MTSLTSLSQHIPALRRYAFSLLRDDQDADDLVQSCLLLAIDKLEAAYPVRNMRAWLFTILHNLFITEKRRLRLQRRILVEGVEADVAVPESQFNVIELSDAWHRLNRLPDEQREVLLLVSVEGLSYAEVASILGIPQGTVMSRLNRARTRMAAEKVASRKNEMRRVK